MNRITTFLNVTAVIGAWLSVSSVNAGIGDPFNGIDVSLIDKSTGSAIYNSPVGPLDLNLTIDNIGADGLDGVAAFVNTGLTSLTPGLNPTDVGYQQAETYTATENFELDLTVADPGTGVQFQAPFSFSLPTDFAQELQLVSITNGGNTFNYDMEITQFDTQLPSILVGNLGTPGDNWTVDLTLVLGTGNPSLGSGALTLLPGGGEQVSAAFTLYRALEVVVTSNVSGAFSVTIPIDAPRTIDAVPEPATITLIGLVALSAMNRKRRGPGASSANERLQP